MIDFLFRLILLFLLIDIAFRVLRFILVFAVRFWLARKVKNVRPDNVRRTFNGREVIDAKFKEIRK